MPFLVPGGDHDQHGKKPESAGTVPGGSSEETPGEFQATPPGTGVTDHNRDNGAWPHLWSRAGTDRQKWSVRRMLRTESAALDTPARPMGAA
ncbi:hypothetical protein [Streptomyces sp. NPDC047108]|uniref:hypothetical protein n=1 Tax=Streptomyces sp. NPDC047108 TaxID=3155025 RepID=UPI00340A8D76